MTWKCTNTAKGDNKLYSDAKGVVPSLDLRFAEGKNLNDYMTGTPLVDHQRSMSGSNLSPGTFVKSNGLIETAKVNLVTYSEGINFWPSSYLSGILPFGSGSIVDATEAPNGTQTADLITSGNTTSLQYVQIETNYTGTHTFSVYLKDAGAGFAQISTNNHGSLYIVNIDLQTGVTSPAGLSENIGNGWYRVFYTNTLDGSGEHRINLVDSITASRSSSFTGDGTSGIYIWGAQLEEGTTATTYIPTTNLPSAAPRFDHDPTTGESLGLLVEESRTNLVTYSEGFDDASWVDNSGNQSTANATEAPDGQNTAYYFYDTNDGIVSNAGIYRVETLSPSSTYTLSCYFKKALNDWVYLRTFSFDATANGFAWFNISNGTVGTVDNTLTAHTPQYTGNGWYRCSISFTMGSVDVSGGLQFGVVSADNTIAETLNGQLGTYVWGAQLEQGSFPTSYIPTTGTALTRSADVASISGSDFSSWYNQSEGTLFSETKGKVTSGGDRDVADISNGQGQPNRILLRDHQLFIIKDIIIQTNIIFTDTLNNAKTAAAFTLNDAVIYSDGANEGTDTSLTLPTVDRIHIGSYNGGGEQLCGCISRLTYFPERLPDATLQTITAP